MVFNVEYTDTFGGEANYSWVRRVDIELPAETSDAALKRAAKRALGLNGVRGKWEKWGDYLAFYPSGECTVMFVTY